MSTIEHLSGREILDSRGRPTVEARCTLVTGPTGIASVPSGISTGAAEAHELRDGDPRRYRGLGCRRAAAAINTEINAAVAGRDLRDQHALDSALIAADGTANHARLGANALLAVSVAFARAVAAERGIPLYRHFAEQIGQQPTRLPRPTINLFSGGKHAGGQVEIQDVLVVPLSTHSIDECLSLTYEIYQQAAERCAERFGMRALSADEGGLAPPFSDAEAMLAEAVGAIDAAGVEPGRHVALAIDVAASHFFDGAGYHLGHQVLDGAAMVDTIDAWVQHFPVISVEDGLADGDWDNWPRLLRRLTGRALVLGDDLLCTNVSLVDRAIEASAANALLLKPNQVGTLTEAADALKAARAAGWSVTASARSGETEDNWLADLAVGWATDHIKIGSITQSERLAKYNRLLQIEAETGFEISVECVGPRRM